jgi:hypothetical protein
MDLFISPDSAFVHIAGAFDKPQIGLYSAFPSMLRMAYFENAVGLNSVVACSPCFKHGHGPCERGNPSPCFSVIDTDNVLHAVDFMVTRQGMEPLGISHEKWRHTEAQKTLHRFAPFLEGQGLDVGCGYFEDERMERFDFMPFCVPQYLKDIVTNKLDKQYDFVFNSFCLNDCDNRETALANMLAMVKPGGYLLMYLPHKEHYPLRGMDEEEIVSLFDSLPDTEIRSMERHALHDLMEYEELDKELEEYAFSTVVRKKNG